MSLPPVAAGGAVALSFASVTKTFSRSQGRALLVSHLKEALGMRVQLKNAFQALHDISFTIGQGESVALIGPNGAGKSTLLSLVAGLAQPDQGSVEVNGRVAALLELGSGFHYDLTGEENARLNAALLGLDRKTTQRVMPEIIEFSGLGDAVKEPLRTYSTGMMMRLAFAVAVNVDPEILLIDEVLAVGDKEFQNRCFDRILSFRKQGKTLVFVSHAFELLKQFCDRAIWLERGGLKMDGPLQQVSDAYLATLKRPQGAGVAVEAAGANRKSQT